jgi:hypothetical protein
MPKLVCVKCQVELRPELNGFKVVEMMSDDRPYKIWDSDKWKCPECGFEVVSGFGYNAEKEHFETGFDTLLGKIEASPKTDWCYDYEKVKAYGGAQ